MSTSRRGQTSNSSTSPDSPPKPKLMWCSYGSYCLQRGGPPTSRRQPVPRLQGGWANDQRKVLSPPPPSPPVISMNNTELEVVDTFTYLGSTVSSSTSLDAEISFRIGNDLLSERTQMCVYQACVLSTLLYDSESWTTYARQERRLNAIHLRCLWRLLLIRWQDRVTNTEVLEGAGLLSMPSLPIQRRLQIEL